LEEQLLPDGQEGLQEVLRQNYFVKGSEPVEEPSAKPTDHFQRLDLEQSRRSEQEAPSEQPEDHQQAW
jgi:hypothetical protein